ncbi:MAG: succinylglutamate desuccinylase/aspartoacylase family protein [Saprospiraceae bacterium]|nr:succinylglutamate desuccinylase/aspartoacylase family protein [Saprospiraceae bacterium]
MTPDRIIGKYTGESPGPLFVVTAAMHGNEHAGVRALELVFKMLEVEPVTNPDFVYHGTMLGLTGNVKAYTEKKRYIHKDINRSWFPEYITNLKKGHILYPEDEEKLQLLECIESEIHTGRYDKLILLDLHTTSSEGGIFSICTEDPVSIHLAKGLHAPVVRGLLNGIPGTTLHYFITENMGIDTHGVAFEAGHHDDPKSINRSIAAIINCMRTIGAVDSRHVENIHDQLLLDYSKNLPAMVNVIYKYTVTDNAKWRMLPGYQHFMKIEAGEILAYDHDKAVKAPFAGMILMPLYQSQGSDGFFIVEECEDLNQESGIVN